MKMNIASIKAIRTLRSMVRYEHAGFQLPVTPFMADNTQEIREATSVFVESWIIPLLDALEVGDADAIEDLMIRTNYGHKLGDVWDAKKQEVVS